MNDKQIKERLRLKTIKSIRGELPQQNSWNYSAEYLLDDPDIVDQAIVSVSPYEVAEECLDKICEDMGTEPIDSVPIKSIKDDKLKYPRTVKREWLLKSRTSVQGGSTYKLYLRTDWLPVNMEHGQVESIRNIEDGYDDMIMNTVKNEIIPGLEEGRIEPYEGSGVYACTEGRLRMLDEE